MSGIAQPAPTEHSADAEGVELLHQGYLVRALERSFAAAKYPPPQIEIAKLEDLAPADHGATLRLYFDAERVQDFGLFGDVSSVESLARDVFKFDNGQALDRNFLLDVLGETLNQFIGRVKGFLLEDTGARCRLDTPSQRPEVASRIFTHAHRDAVLLRIRNIAWHGPLYFVASPSQDPLVLGLQEARTGLEISKDGQDSLFWVQRRLDETSEFLASRGSIPANQRAISWCACSVEQLSGGMDSDAAKALRDELHRELKHLEASVRQICAPSSESSFVPPTDDDSLEMLESFCSDTREELKTARNALQDASPESVNAILRSIHTVKGGAGFMELAQLQDLAHITEDLLTEARDAGVHLSGDQRIAVERSVDLIGNWVVLLEQSLEDQTPIPFNPCIEEHRRAIEHALVARSPIITHLNASAPCEQETPSGASIKVSAEHIEELQSIRDQFCSLIQQIEPTVNDPHRVQNFAKAQSLSERLARTIRAINTVSLRSLFSKIARLARDTADREGKAVRVDTTGEALEVPRHLVSILSGPLVHLARNAVGHGLETTEERMASEKELVARISLGAYWKEGYLVVEVSDDGRGIRAEDILAKATSLGLIEPNALTTDEQVFSLMMEPGFSTAKETTDLAGRGVGLDVVKRDIESNGGLIDVSSTLGSGTLFRIALPTDPSLCVPRGLFEESHASPALALVPDEPEEAELAAAGEVLFF